MVFPSIVIGTKHITLSALLILIIGALVLFHLRARWLPRFRAWLSRRRIRLDGYNAVSSFQNDLESGLSSDHFDLNGNLINDSRKGLDETAKSEILRLMKDRGLSFDEARLQYTRSKLSQNNIGPDGVPLDPKTVTFSR